jgi:hypothetical protein
MGMFNYDTTYTYYGEILDEIITFMDYEYNNEIKDNFISAIITCFENFSYNNDNKYKKDINFRKKHDEKVMNEILDDIKKKIDIKKIELNDYEDLRLFWGKWIDIIEDIKIGQGLDLSIYYR